MHSIFFTGILLISEVMYDPDPQVGLPPYEYVEIFNPGDAPADLTGWQWLAGGKVKKFTGGVIGPGGYVIVCSPAAVASLRSFGQVVALESFPTLRNSGDRLVLISPDGAAVDIVDYSPDLYTDALKAAGGWSLELADMDNQCGKGAWQPSADPSGGTPGRANSLDIQAADPDPAVMARAAGYDAGRFVVLFNGKPDPAPDMNNYSCRLMPGDIPAEPSVSPVYGFPGLFFRYPDGLNRDSVYSVELTGDIRDCAGRKAVLRPVKLGFPSAPKPGDLIISEVMFDPLAGQPEFIEIYNRSSRVAELGNLMLARAGPDGRVVDYSGRQTDSYWLFPGGYAVLCENAEWFRNAWPEADPGVSAERSDWPSLTNEESVLMLLDSALTELDRVIYSPGWHYPYLEETKGVSLERIDPDRPGTERTNWLSASAASGFATPGAPNSCVLVGESNPQEQFSIEPVAAYAADTQSPLQVVLKYRFEEPGWFLRVFVYTETGLPVKEIFPFGMAGTEGVCSWNGLDAKDMQVPDGIYLMVADYYHPSGKKGRWKGACGVVRN